MGDIHAELGTACFLGLTRSVSWVAHRFAGPPRSRRLVRRLSCFDGFFGRDQGHGLWASIGCLQRPIRHPRLCPTVHCQMKYLAR
jgi:hypothetical protein